jgi:hypothetical protein
MTCGWLDVPGANRIAVGAAEAIFLWFVPGWLVISLLLACYWLVILACGYLAGALPDGLRALTPLSSHDASAPSWMALGPRTDRTGGLLRSADDSLHEPTGRVCCEPACRLSSALQATLPPLARAIQPVPFSGSGMTHDAGKLSSSFLDSDDRFIPSEE